MRKGSRRTIVGKVLIMVALSTATFGCATVRMQRTQAQVQVANLNIANLNAALAIYYFDTGGYPSENEGLAALLRSVAPGFSTYLTRIPADPWGRPYRYRLIDNFPRIDSAGPDGIFGTADDVHD